MQTITIGIPTLNRSCILKKTVLNVINNSIVNVIELIIVDQTDDTIIIEDNKLFFNTLDFKIKYITLNEPSVCRARNIIIKESNSDIIFFIDDDVILSNNYFNEHLYIYNTSNVVSTIGKIYNRKQNFNMGNLNINYPSNGTIEN